MRNIVISKCGASLLLKPFGRHAGVIVREKDKGKQNTCLHVYFILPAFTVCDISVCPTGNPAWYLCFTGIIVMPVNFCRVTWVWIMGIRD